MGMGIGVVVAALAALAASLLPWITIVPPDPTAAPIDISLLSAVPAFGYADALLALPIVALAFGVVLIRGSREAWVGWGAAIAFFAAAVVAAIVGFWIQNADQQLASWSVPAGALGIGSGVVVYALAAIFGVIAALGTTRQFKRYVEAQFTTRVIVLMPVAIAINIVLGYTVQTVLKLPIYLDSIGTITVGVLAGPLAGALTGILSNLIWQYAPVIGGGTIGPFAVVAGVIGVLAGIWGYLGIYRSRPARPSQLVLGAVVAAALAILVIVPLVNNPIYQNGSENGFVAWAVPAAIGIAIVVAVVIAAFIYMRRDMAGLWVAIAGIVTGFIAAVVSAPIAAIVFGGVTGSGTDLIVAALRQGGADVLQASLGQGFFSDPIDKLITSFVVFMILSSLSPRYLARFPLGERLIRREPAGAVPMSGAMRPPETPPINAEDQ